MPPKDAPKRGIPLLLAESLHDGRFGYPGQETWLKAAYLYSTVVIAVARQVGKTTFCKFLLLDEFAKFRGFYRAAYMAQGHAQAEDMYEECLSAFEAGHLVNRSKNKSQDRWIELKPVNGNRGGKVWFVSGDPEAHTSFQGKSLDRGILDEASLCPSEAWFGTIVPMFNATGGRGLVIGSPYPEGLGFAWFEKLWKTGDPTAPKFDPALAARNPEMSFRDEDCISFTAPSESNPHSPLDQIARNRRSCTSREQELCLYDGRFAKDMGAVFSNLDAVFTLHAADQGNLWVVEPHNPLMRYVAGLDFGKHHDYTVLSIFTLEERPRQVLLCRLQGEYHKQMATLARHIDAYGRPTLYAEGREGGTVLTEMLRQRYGEGCRIVKWATGGKWDKESAVLRGIDLFQQAGWSLIDVRWQREEFRLFSKTRRGEHATGFRYEAPPGCHDDSVAANLYAAYGMPMVNRVRIELEPETPKSGTAAWWELMKSTQRRTRIVNGPAAL